MHHIFIHNMRHRIKSSIIGSFSPKEFEKKLKEQRRNEEIAEEVEDIFEEDTTFSDSDEAFAAMEFYDSPDAME